MRKWYWYALVYCIVKFWFNIIYFDIGICGGNDYIISLCFSIENIFIFDADILTGYYNIACNGNDCINGIFYREIIVLIPYIMVLEIVMIMVAVLSILWALVFDFSLMIVLLLVLTFGIVVIMVMLYWYLVLVLILASFR